jgi:transglutaminase-like putative cysteine protease
MKKLVKNLKGFISDRNVRFSFLLLVLGSISLYIFQVFLKHKKLVSGDYYAMFGIYIGSIISLFVLYNLFIRPKVRLLSFLFTTIVSLTIVLFINELAHSFASGVNIDITFPKISSETLEIFMIGIWIGSIIMSGIYLILTKFNTTIPVIIVFLGAIANDYYWYRGQGLDLKYFVTYLILFIVTIIVASVFSLKKFGVQKSEILSLIKSKASAIVLFIFIISTFSSIYAIEWLNKTAKRIENIQSDQTAEKERKEDETKALEENIGAFGERKSNSNASLIGYYKAEKPLHLKTEVLFVDQERDLLSVIPFSAKSQEYFDFVDKDFLSEDQQIQIIYATTFGEPLPSAEKIVQFSNYIYSPDSGLLKPFSSGFGKKTNFVEYDYAEFSEQKYKKGGYLGIDIKQKTDEPYAQISPDSQRYNEIRSLAQDITKSQPDNYSKAKAIESYLRSNYLYSLSPSIEDQKSPIDDFIFDTKTGYCTHFSTAMTMMLQSIGINARMVGGFYSTAYSSNLGAYVMSNKDLHAWVEVFVDGYGWVTFDPTTSRLAPDTKLSDLTGSARDFTNYSKTEVDSLLKPLGTVRTGFDDIFEERTIGALPPTTTATSFEDTREQWLTDEAKTAQVVQQLEDEQKESQEEREKVEKLKQQRSNQLKKPFKIFVIFTLSILAIAISYVLIKYLIIRIKNKKGYAILRDQNTVRKIEYKIRKHLIQKFELPDDLEPLSNKEFLDYLSYKIDVSDDLKEFYKRVDRVLYAREYQKEDMAEVREFWKKRR